MKHINYYARKALLILTAIFLFSTAFGQDKVEINGHNVGSWFSSHWMWIGGLVILLILLLLAAAGRNSTKQKSTTVIKDSSGRVKSVTTTERTDD
jgi:formate-dependent nitrite reductase membrane component NrfD